VPMPTAWPSTAATTGFGQVRRALRKVRPGLSPPAATSWKSLRSLPAVKQPPAPVSTTTPTASSWAAAATAAVRPA
jgi:hypothetical protein